MNLKIRATNLARAIGFNDVDGHYRRDAAVKRILKAMQSLRRQVLDELCSRCGQRPMRGGNRQGSALCRHCWKEES